VPPPPTLLPPTKAALIGGLEAQHEVLLAQLPAALREHYWARHAEACQGQGAVQAAHVGAGHALRSGGSCEGPRSVHVGLGEHARRDCRGAGTAQEHSAV
jgi:hypothetical protein